MCVCVCGACVRACVRACERSAVRVCTCECVCARAREFFLTLFKFFVLCTGLCAPVWINSTQKNPLLSLLFLSSCYDLSVRGRTACRQCTEPYVEIISYIYGSTLASKAQNCK